MNRVLRWIVPGAAIGAVFGASFWARAMGWIPDPVAFWLWPSLVLVAWLALGALVLLRGVRIWLWPIGAAAVTQLVGLMLLLAETFESPWEPLGWSLGAAALALAVMGVVWLANYFRARTLERRLSEGLAEGLPGNEAELGRIRKDMHDALALLRRAGRGRNAIYELPWLLVMGRPAAGKTVAVKNSGLGLPVRKDWVKGVGGTYTCDWFFTNDLIFLDTPGKWVTEGTDEAGQKQWKTLLRLLRKHRGRRPLDGLVVVVPADDLLSKDDEELEEQAANVREVVDLMHDELQFRFPLYLLVTKCDLVEGFVDFFRGLPAQRRNEILGWSNEDPNDSDLQRLIHGGFQRVQRRLEAYRLEMLGRIAKRAQVRKLFFFTEDFRALERPLALFAEVLFEADRFHEPPVFRGFYFTSGTQGEGAPLSRAMSALARTLGVSETRQAGPAEEEPKRSYFLLDLFRELMVQDEGLVGRTAGHWWRQRRNTMLGAFAPAGLALLVLVLSLVSFVWQRNIYRGFLDAAPRIVGDLEALRGRELEERIEKSLPLTERLRSYHRRMAYFSPLRSLGMRRPDSEVARTSLDLFRGQFSRSILEPLLGRLQEVATDPGPTCADRVSYLRSVIWLRQGKRFDTEASLATLLEDRTQRELLLAQYRHFKDHPGRTATDLLPGFSIRGVAESIKADCSEIAGSSALAMYDEFQKGCRELPSDALVEECYGRLSNVLNSTQQDFAEFSRRIEEMVADLDSLQGVEPEAQWGRELLAAIPRPEVAEGNSCLEGFVKNQVEDVRHYVDNRDLLETCRGLAGEAPSLAAKLTATVDVRRELEQRLEERGKKLAESFRDFNQDCRGAIDGFTRLDYDTLQSVVTTDFWVRCSGGSGARPAPAVRAPQAPVAAVKRAPPPPRRPSLSWLESAAPVPAQYTRSGWELRYRQWTDQLAAAEVGFTEEQKRQAQRTIEGEIRSYGARYAEAWKKYLGGLTVTPRRLSEADWLRKLAATDEFQKVLAPAGEALEIQGVDAPPFDAAKSPLRPLEAVAGFVGSDLSVYREKLNQIAGDLDRCLQDDSFFARYQHALTSGERTNSLVDARNWVRINVDPLVDGRLTRLFGTPLAAAEEFVRSDSLLNSRRADLRRLYDEEFRGRPPFGSQPGEAAPVTVEALKALLGGATGAVARLREAGRSGNLTEAEQQWLEQAERVSKVFFEPGKDELRPIRVRLEIGEATYDPASYGKKHEVAAVNIVLGPDQKFIWKAGAEPSATLELPLFGDDASRTAFLSSVLTERKGFLGRIIGENLRELAPITADNARVEDVPLAPLKLLQVGRPSGGGALSYRFEVTNDKGKQEATVTLPVTISGSEVLRLLELMDEGLPPPPSAVGG